MSLMINDPAIAEELLAQRRAQGADRYDEVWEDVYMMAPAPNNEHQELASELTAILRSVIDWKGLGHTLLGANVSDRAEDWTRNYRVPDVLVFLTSTKAIDRQTHWQGGPDFVIEIVSPGDRTLDKLDFYAALGTRELLIVDRDPWQLTLYRNTSGGQLLPVAVSSFQQQVSIASEVVPIRLVIEPEASVIRVSQADGSLLRTIPIAKR